MRRFALALALAATLGSAASGQPQVDARTEALGYWAQAKANGAPPRVGGCLSPTAARRIIALQSAAATADQAAWLDAWLQASQAYDQPPGPRASSWRAQQEIVDRLPESPADDAALKSGLAARASLDRSVRAVATPAGLSPLARAIHDSLLAQAVCRVDESNARWLKAVVAERGWPDRKRFGPEADRAAWLLTQHAKEDPAWRRDALAILRGLLDSDATDPANVAHLGDAVAIAEGRPQRYGTQGSCVAPGRWLAEPVNTEEVDERRAELGMSSFADYGAEMSKSCR